MYSPILFFPTSIPVPPPPPPPPSIRIRDLRFRLSIESWGLNVLVGEGEDPYWILMETAKDGTTRVRKEVAEKFGLTLDVR